MKKNKQSKSFIMGLVIGLMLSSTVFASSDKIQAVFTDLKLIINGKSVALETKPLLYNGTSYLPLRDVSGLLGYDVGYDATTKTITLDENKDGKSNIKKSEDTSKEIAHKVENKVNLGDFEITVTGIDYVDSIAGQTPPDGKVFATVDFDIFTKATPKYDSTWRASEFIYRFNTPNDEITRINGSRSEETTIVYPNKQNKVMVYAIIDNNQKLTSVTFYNPMTDKTSKVDLN